MTKYLKEFSPDEPLVAMIEFNGTLFVASTKGVYKMIEDEFHPVMFVSQSEGMLVEMKEEKTDG